MPHKFQKGDPVFHKGEGYENIAGHYNVTEVSKDGTIYRVTDANDDFTDANEEELEHVLYAVFTRVEHGWPIIIPAYDQPLYKYYLNSGIYKFICEASARECIEEQTKILKALESASH